MESLQFPHFDSRCSNVHIALFRNVSNSSSIKSRIIEASTTEGELGEKAREAVNFAFINARLVCHEFSHGASAFSETILSPFISGHEQVTPGDCHSPSNIGGVAERTTNEDRPFRDLITEAIRRYGVSNEDSDVILVRIDSPDLTPSIVQEKMKDVVSGDLVPFSELENVTDWASIKKYYKLNNEVAVKEAADNLVRERAIVDNIVISSVAMKNVMA
ncbi:hypothetical protein CVT25_010676 [Psilocybe cyanescens]|uniref:EKC/KEOPS complex subunit CGI121 n=1 Tax=Psilocybe cyanescens TaxID=93625 RepID=A0A409WJY1_PSICY|nr:hypothetical protein CVT25_010676 [Psilocybe cyanescens]